MNCTTTTTSIYNTWRSSAKQLARISKSSHTELDYLETLLMKWTVITLTKLKVGKWESINFLIWLKISLLALILVKNRLKLIHSLKRKRLMLAMLEKLIGELRELLLLLRIKENVGHAGLLLQLLLMKPIKFNLEINLKTLFWVNNNLLIVQLLNPMETQVAMEAME